MKNYQLTLFEIINESNIPKKEKIHNGAFAFSCPLCNTYVGIYRNDEGYVYKRNKCVYGHSIDWINFN